MYISFTNQQLEIDAAAAYLATLAYAQFPADFSQRSLSEHIQCVVDDCAGCEAVLVHDDDGTLLGGCVITAPRKVHHCVGECVLVMLSYCTERTGAGRLLYRAVLDRAAESACEYVGWTHKTGLHQYQLHFKRTKYGRNFRRWRQGSSGSSSPAS